MNVDFKMIGERIRLARKRMGYTQEKLAERLDVTIGYVSQVERGATKISLDLLAEIAAVLNCDLSDFLSGASIRTEQYYIKEIGEEFKLLNENEKKLVRAFIKLLLENRVK